MTTRSLGALAVAIVAVLAVTAGSSAQRRQRRPPARRLPAPTLPTEHPSITDGLSCGACHTPAGWSEAGGSSANGGFDHARTGFPLSGRHLAAGCTACHTPRRQMRRDCVSCHRDQHQGRLGVDCARCHTAISWHDTRAIEIHRLTRLPLSGMHALAACSDCHRRTGERQYSGAPSECFSCHEAEYRTAGVHPSHTGTATSPPFSRDCSSCHRTSAWSPAIIDPTSLGSASMDLTERAPPRHELRFPITRGSHRGADCASCHADPRTPSAVRCNGCHAHNPVRLREQHRTAAPGADGRGCLGCHPGGIVR